MSVLRVYQLDVTTNVNLLGKKNSMHWFKNAQIWEPKKNPWKFSSVVLEKDGEDQFNSVKNEEALYSVKEERNILRTVNERRLTGLVKFCVGTVF